VADAAETTWIGKVTRKIRFLVRDPDINAEVEGDEMLSYFIEPSCGEMLQAISMSSENAVLCRHSISLVANQQFYELPPHVRQVFRVGTMNAAGYVIFDLIPRSQHNPGGPCWSVNGNTLEIRPFPVRPNDYSVDGTIDIWFYPSGDVRLHYGSGTVDATDVKTVVLDSTPEFGELDDRPHAYAGTILRLRESPTTSHVIESYDRATQTATLRTGVAASLLGTGLDYEILPPIGYNLWDLVAHHAALQILAFKSATTKYTLVEREMAKRIKGIRDQYSNIQGRTPKRFETDTIHGGDGVLTPFGWAMGQQVL
jgi:hypothetical protein